MQCKDPGLQVRFAASGLALVILSVLPLASLLYAASIDQVLETALPGARLATASDFAPALEEKYRGDTVRQADFNGDGLNDWAVLVVLPRSNAYGVYYIISSEDGPKSMRLVSREHGAEQDAGFIKTPMFFKPAGELGIAARDYNSLAEDSHPGDFSPDAVEKRVEQRAKRIAPYRAVPAIEAWTGASNSQEDQTLEEMAYCSHAWYFDKGALKTFSACD